MTKRFPGLPEDVESFIKYELAPHHLAETKSSHIYPIPGLGLDPPSIFKAKQFSCRALKKKGSNTGMRVIYRFVRQDQSLTLIQIYFKGDSENEDRERIRRFIRDPSS